MNRSWRLLALIPILTLSLATPAVAQLSVGAVAPDFTRIDTNGVSHSLSDHADQVVVLYFVGHG